MIEQNNKGKRDYYTCKRLRLLNHLKSNGFTPFATIPEPTNHNYNWWLFENSPELEKCINEYFENLKQRQLKQ